MFTETIGRSRSCQFVEFVVEGGETAVADSPMVKFKGSILQSWRRGGDAGPQPGEVARKPKTAPEQEVAKS